MGETKIQKVISAVDYSNGKDMTAATLAIISVEKTIILCTRIIKEAIQSINTLHDDIYLCYPNRRIAWLARHHRSERVRKKNMRHLIKWLKRGCR